MITAIFCHCVLFMQLENYTSKSPPTPINQHLRCWKKLIYTNMDWDENYALISIFSPLDTLAWVFKRGFLCTCNTYQRFVKGLIRVLHRASFKNAHILLNLMKELGKRDKMWGLPGMSILFCNEFNKFNNTWTRMLDSIYHMTLR